MCGIAGAQGELETYIPACLSSLSHRGPDAEGTFKDKNTLLVHTRLSILDLSEAGNQPMSNEDETVWVVHNGEIYNTPQLRKELESKGHTFKSRSDTEVLLHLFEEEGDTMVSRLRGMYSFSIYNKERGELFLARDPFGIKPLVYAQLPSGFVFASELKTLISMVNFPREIDREALIYYFHFNYIPAPFTIWRHARKLKPGYCLKVKNGKITDEYPYWHLTEKQEEMDFEDAVSSLEKVIKESVRIHLNSDVPVGAFLSGGVDSSLIATLAQIDSKRPLQTFTVTYPEFPYLDESVYAAKVARSIDSQHTEIPVLSRDIYETIGEITDHLDEPFGDPALVPTAVLSKLTRKHVKVALSGDGGDELFAGYTKYQALKAGIYLRHFQPILKTLRHLPLKEGRSFFLGDKTRQVKKFANTLDNDTLQFITNLMSVFPPGETNNIFRNKISDATAKKAIKDILNDYAPMKESDMNKYLFLDTRFVLPNDMLFKIDAASMRYSLEVRVPFVDREVVELISSFPGNWKLKGLKRKYILRAMAKRYLPRDILGRRKMGFNVPIGEWCRQELSATFEEEFDVKRQGEVEFLNFERIDTLFREHQSGKRERFFELWNIYVFLRWWRKYGN